MSPFMGAFFSICAGYLLFLGAIFSMKNESFFSQCGEFFRFVDRRSHLQKLLRKPMLSLLARVVPNMSPQENK